MNTLGKAGVPFVFLLDFELKQPMVIALSQVRSDQLVFAVGEKTNVTPEQPVIKQPNFEKTPIDFAEYLAGFDHVMSQIRYGNSFLCNYTIRTPIKTNLSLLNIFHLSKAAYRVCVPGKFVCFSPEIFVRISAEGVISSHPMKGTIDATLPDAEQQLLSDEKELAEHYTIVDLIRNDLSLVATRVHVRRFRYIERVRTRQKDLLQASSEIVGTLPKNWKQQLGSIFKKILPAGSISGAPKRKTLEIIKAAEHRPRGYYTGVFGIFDGATLDSGVLIRYIEQDAAGQLWFRSGGGITCMSEAASEYDECNAKIYLPKV